MSATNDFIIKETNKILRRWEKTVGTIPGTTCIRALENRDTKKKVDPCPVELYQYRGIPVERFVNREIVVEGTIFEVAEIAMYYEHIEWKAPVDLVPAITNDIITAQDHLKQNRETIDKWRKYHQLKAFYENDEQYKLYQILKAHFES